MSPQPLPVPVGLFWVQPRTESGYHELHDVDNRLVGTLRFEAKPAVTWGFTDPRRARGEIGASHWDVSIERKGVSGLAGASATVLIDDGKTGTMTAGAFFATGVLSLARGARVQWKGSVFEGTPCIFVDDGEQVLVQIDAGSFLTRVNGTIDVAPQAADSPEWPLLVVLALYLRLLMNRGFE